MDTTIDNHEMNEDNQHKQSASVQNSVVDVWYAGFWMRFWAFLLDLVVVGSLHRLIVYPVFKLSGVDIDQTFMFSPAVIATTIVGFAYFVLMTRLFQQTLGKMVFGLKVINKAGGKPSWSAVLFREVVGKFISETVLFIGYVAVVFSKKKQAWHDMIADTYVIHQRS